MKKIIFTVIATTILLTGNSLKTEAQRISAKWEAIFNKDLQGTSIYDSYLGEDETFYYVLTRKAERFSSLKYATIKYDKKSLQPKEEKMLQDSKYKYSISRVCRILDRTFMCIREYNGVGQIFEYNFADNTANPMKNGYSAELFSSQYFYYAISPDSSNVLFIARKKPEKNTNTDKYQLMLFDSKFNKKWEKEVATPFIDAQNFALDNGGNVYMAGKIYKDGTKKGSTEKAAYEYSILKLSGENFSRQHFKINMDGKLYQNCLLFVDKKSTLSIVGFYSSLSNLEDTGGFYCSINKGFNKAENLSFQPIPLKYLALNHNGSDVKKIEKNLDNKRYAGFEFGDILYADNGDIVVCAEENSDKIARFLDASGSNITGSAQYSYFWDIYVFNINSETGLKWIKRVPKNQKSSDRDGALFAPSNADVLSYQAFLSGDNTILFFMDNAKNEAITENTDKIPVAWGGGIKPMGVILDKNGVEKRKLLNLDNEDLLLEVAKSTRLSNEKIIIAKRKNKQCKLGIISVD